MSRYDSPVLQYQRVADAIAAQIDAGQLRPGDKLPSEQHLAEEYEVAYSTARRAMKELRDRGLVESIWGKGTFIKEPGTQNQQTED